MWTRTFLVAALALTGASAADESVDVYITLAVLQPASLGRFKASQLAKSSLPESGDRLQVRIAAGRPCHGIVVAFDAAGKIAYSDQPVDTPLRGGDQRQIPSHPGWKWEIPDSVRELDVLLVDNRSPALARLTQLIEAMHEQVAPAVRARQLGELRRMMDALTQRGRAIAEYSLKTDPVPLAGLMRNDLCDWCKDAFKVSLPASGSYLVRQRFPIENPK